MHNDTYLERVVYRQPFGWTYSDVNKTYHFSFEEVDPFWWVSFVESNWQVPAYVGAAYIVSIFGLKRFMKNRPAFQFTVPLFLWNLALGIFSIIGFFRVLPNMLDILSEPDGFYKSVCRKTRGSIPMGYWLLVFGLSKFVELGDTVFIVLRKRPLVFLQWYHHLVTMSVSWILSPFMEPIIRWFALLNYGVHSLMYPYFAFKAIGTKISRSVANCITTLQLAQMIMGLFINMGSIYYQRFVIETGQDCFRHPKSVKVLAYVYGSFLVLFGKLFYDAVIKTNITQRSPAKKGPLNTHRKLQRECFEYYLMHQKYKLL